MKNEKKRYPFSVFASLVYGHVNQAKIYKKDFYTLLFQSVEKNFRFENSKSDSSSQRVNNYKSLTGERRLPAEIRRHYNDYNDKNKRTDLVNYMEEVIMPYLDGVESMIIDLNRELLDNVVNKNNNIAQANIPRKGRGSGPIKLPSGDFEEKSIETLSAPALTIKGMVSRSIAYSRTVPDETKNRLYAHILSLFFCFAMALDSITEHHTPFFDLSIDDINLELIDIYIITAKKPAYRSFILKVLEKYYGKEFMFSMNDTVFAAYPIEPSSAAKADRLITDMDDIICNKNALDTRADTEVYEKCFDVHNHQKYVYYPKYQEYHDLVRANIHYPDRPGYMFDKMILKNGKYESVTAHVGTYAENVYSSHVLEYELYQAYETFHDKDLDDPEVWKEVSAFLTLRNKTHNGIDIINKPGSYQAQMLRSLLVPEGRESLMAVQMLVLIQSARTGEYEMKIGQRSTKVAMLPNVYEFAPAGGFEVLNDSEDNFYEDYVLKNQYSPGYCVFKEYLEELFDVPEAKGESKGEMSNLVTNDPRIQKIEEMIQEGKAVFQFLGVSIDLILLRQSFCFALVIKDPEYSRTVFKTNTEFRNSRLLEGITLSSIDNNKDLWKNFHGTSAAMWYLFKKTQLYLDIKNES